MFCTSCGAKIEDGSVFCTVCGARVEEDAGKTVRVAAVPNAEDAGDAGPEEAPWQYQTSPVISAMPVVPPAKKKNGLQTIVLAVAAGLALVAVAFVVITMAAPAGTKDEGETIQVDSTAAHSTTSGTVEASADKDDEQPSSDSEADATDDEQVTTSSQSNSSAQGNESSTANVAQDTGEQNNEVAQKPVEPEQPTTPVTPVEPEPKHANRYELVVKDVSWSQANSECMSKGGHLATITSAEEMDTLIAMANAAGISYVWLGGYTNGSSGAGEWVTGEPFSYSKWYEGEPSHYDTDGTPESYIEMWKLKSTGEWSWNDERDNPVVIREMSYMSGNMGYICEYED